MDKDANIGKMLKALIKKYETKIASFSNSFYEEESFHYFPPTKSVNVLLPLI